jgi:hypothetical protein
MGLAYKGLEIIAKALVEESYVGYGNTHAHLGVGDGDEEFAPSQTDLQGTNKLRKPVEPGYPIVNGREMAWRAFFEADDANFAWKEVIVINAPAEGDMLAREVEDLGTKNSPSIWVLTITGTLDVPA